MVPRVLCQVCLVLAAVAAATPRVVSGQEPQLVLHTQIDEGRVGLMRVDALIRMMERERWPVWWLNSARLRSIDTLRTFDPALVVEVSKAVRRCDPGDAACEPVRFAVRTCEGAPPGVRFSVRAYEPYCHARAVADGRAAPGRRQEVPATCEAADARFGALTRAQRSVDLSLEHRGDGRLQMILTGPEVRQRTGNSLVASMPVFSDQTLPMLTLNVGVAVEELERHLSHADSAQLLVDDDPPRPLGIVTIPEIRSTMRVTRRPAVLNLPFDDLTRLASANRAVVAFHDVRVRLERDDLNAMNAIARRIICAADSPSQVP